MTAFQAIPGSSDSLRPLSRTELYTNFRDTTDYYVKVMEKSLRTGLPVKPEEFCRRYSMQ